MRINKATLDLVKHFEGKRLKAYKDPVGIVTIGYGYTNRAGFGPGVSMGDTWTEAQAEDMLHEGLSRFGAEVEKHLKLRANENEFGAMVSLAYNIGLGAFSRSTMLKRFNVGDKQGAAEALTWFNKAGGKVLKGLIRRREAEKALFLTPVGAAQPQRPSARPSTAKRDTAAVGGAVAASGAAAAAFPDYAAQIIGAVLFIGVVVLGVKLIRRQK